MAENGNQKPPSEKRELPFPKRARFKPPPESLEDYVAYFGHSPKELFQDSGARMGIKRMPKDLNLYLQHRLKADMLRGWPRKSSAIAHRILIRAGLPYMENLLRGCDRFTSGIYRSFSDDDPPKRIVAESSKPDLKTTGLGWGSSVKETTTSIYFCLEDEKSRVMGLSEQTGIEPPELIVLIFIAALSISRDEKCVPLWVREKSKKAISEFIKMIKKGKLG